MPRLTDRRYLDTCHRLHQLWRIAPDVYSLLAAAQQWQLHDYFQPSKDLTDPERLGHRVQVTRERPNLPQQAGRALARLYDAAAVWAWDNSTHPFRH